jgi:hypothetical protein
MSPDHETASHRIVEELIDEARSTTDKPARVESIDWDRVDAELFARVEREAAETRALAAHRGRPGAWLLLGGVAAAAAAAALFVQPSAPQTPPAQLASASGSAGDLTLQKGAGEIRVSGAKARTGAHARAGDTIGTRGAKAVFEAPGRVSWLMEDESIVTVERAGAPGTPVVLALRQGALEAEVAPVASGEAFAVDVDEVRVAVHGTHLRVARDGDHIVVDLTEGVVSIGAPPKIGSTYGTLVTAPAHVEFHAGALDSSLTVDHTPSAVRRAADLDSVMDDDNTASVTPPPAPLPRGDESTTPAPKHGARATAPARPAAPPAAPSPEEVITAAFRDCAATAQPRSSASDGKTTISISRILTFDVNDERHVSNTIKYDQPFGPDHVYETINSCAARVIYKARFAPGHYEIPISFELR